MNLNFVIIPTSSSTDETDHKILGNHSKQLQRKKILAETNHGDTTDKSQGAFFISSTASGSSEDADTQQEEFRHSEDKD